MLWQLGTVQYVVSTLWPHSVRVHLGNVCILRWHYRVIIYVLSVISWYVRVNVRSAFRIDLAINNLNNHHNALDTLRSNLGIAYRLTSK